MVFYDSESHVSTEITDEEIHRALAYQAHEPGSSPVTKDHNLYLLCARFHTDRSREKVRGDREWKRGQKSNVRDYYGEHDFARQFWLDVDTFARWNEKTYVFAHNAKYDTQVTRAVRYLIELGYRATGFCDTNPFFLKFIKTRTYEDKNGKEKTAKKTILLLTSTNYYAQSLKSLGDIFGLEKLDFDHGHKVNMNDAEDREKAVTYCRRDVEILERAMIEFIAFIQREGLGNFSMTVAGQSFAAYRRKFMPQDTIFIHSDKRALEVERRAYAGGRNEVFTIGKVQEWSLVNDINSMYPFIMKDKIFPVKLKSFWEYAEPDDVRRAIMDDYLICCDVLVNTPEPIFHKKAGKLIFPTGQFWTTLSTPELIEGFNRGYILAVKNVCVYEGAAIFADFVNYFYNARLQAKHKSDEVHSHLYKIIMNSLYGKFGQKNIVWEQIAECDPEELGVDTVIDPDGTRRMIKIFGGAIWERNEDEDNLEAYDSFPAIAAHVTSAARMLLYNFMEIAGMENVHYCDTDSLFVTVEGHTRLWLEGLIDPDNLGALKLEKYGDDLEIFGCKYYYFNSKLKVKGVPKGAKKIDPDEHGRPRYAMTQWGGFSDRLKEKSFNRYYNKVIIKTLKGNYDKGVRKGNRIVPFSLNEGSATEAMKEIEEARKQMAAAISEPFDLLKTLVQRYGYIRKPEKGQRFAGEYAKLPQKVQRMFFRIDRGEPLDVWAEDNGMSASELLDLLNRKG
jgi:hypothetical protein